jgi:hypothetical protein
MNNIDWIVQGTKPVCLTLGFPEGYWPHTVSKVVYERSWKLSLPFPFMPYWVHTFIGLDQPDHAECDVEIYSLDDDLQDWWTRELHAVRVFVRARKMPTVQRIRAHFGVKMVGEAR